MGNGGLELRDSDSSFWLVFAGVGFGLGATAQSTRSLAKFFGKQKYGDGFTSTAKPVAIPSTRAYSEADAYARPTSPLSRSFSL